MRIFKADSSFLKIFDAIDENTVSLPVIVSNSSDIMHAESCSQRTKSTPYSFVKLMSLKQLREVEDNFCKLCGNRFEWCTTNLEEPPVLTSRGLFDSSGGGKSSSGRLISLNSLNKIFILFLDLEKFLFHDFASPEERFQFFVDSNLRKAIMHPAFDLLLNIPGFLFQDRVQAVQTALKTFSFKDNVALAEIFQNKTDELVMGRFKRQLSIEFTSSADFSDFSKDFVKVLRARNKFALFTFEDARGQIGDYEFNSFFFLTCGQNQKILCMSLTDFEAVVSGSYHVDHVVVDTIPSASVLETMAVLYYDELEYLDDLNEAYIIASSI